MSSLVFLLIPFTIVIKALESPLFFQDLLFAPKENQFIKAKGPLSFFKFRDQISKKKSRCFHEDFIS